MIFRANTTNTPHALRSIVRVAVVALWTAAAARADAQPSQLYATDRTELTGDWNGARSGLAERGVELEVGYVFDAIGNLAGGQSRGFVPIGSADLVLSMDLDALMHWPGASVRVYGLGVHAESLSALTGDLQAAENLEAVSAFRLFEAWLQQELGTERASVRVGLYDVNTEFDVIPPAALFIHSSPGMGADFGNAGTNGPSSFPVTSLAGRLDVRPSEMTYVRAVVAEGVPGNPAQPNKTRERFQPDEGVMLVGEVGVYHAPGEERDSRQRRFKEPLLSDDDAGEGWFGKYAIGAWGFTGNVQAPWSVSPMLPGRSTRGSYGAYVIASQRLYYEPGRPEQGLSAYVRPGVADRRINLFDAYLGAGLVYRGAFPGRDGDRAGISLAAAHFGPAYLDDLALAGIASAAWEVDIEVTYRAQILGWLHLQPDLQVIVNPGGRRGPAPALVLGLRTMLVL